MSTARDAIDAYLLAQVSALDQGGRAVLAGDPEGVHDVRVACRRARSALRAHRPLLRRRERPAAVALAEELRCLGADLTGTRDDEAVAEVVRGWAEQDGWDRATLEAALAALGTGHGEQPPGPDVVVARAADLGRTLGQWRGGARWRPAADRPASEVLPAVVARAARRVAERAELAQQAEPAQAGGTAPTGPTGPASGQGEPGAPAADPVHSPWHEVRKAAKRLRYAAEVAAPEVAGAGAVVRAAKAVQTLLGDRQDAAVVLWRLSAHPGLPGHPTATALLVADRAGDVVRRAEQEAPAVVAAAVDAAERLG